jgi:3-methylfumaryl-CoA hydratase
MLAGYAEEIGGKCLRDFSYRGLAPALLGDAITLQSIVQNDRITLTALLSHGTACMQAEATTG